MSFAVVKSNCPCSFFLRKFPISPVPITSGSTAGYGSNYNKKCDLTLPMISQIYGSLRSVGPEKRLPEVGGGDYLHRAQHRK